jgi:AcrR family transcriptional regulator
LNETGTQERTGAVRLQIIDSGWRQAAEIGFSSLTLHDICADTGLEPSIVHALIPDKDALLIGLLNDDQAQLEGVLYRLDATSLDEMERLSRFVQGALQIAGTAERAKVITELWATVLSRPDLSDWAAERIRGRRTILRNWIDRAGGLRFSPVPPNALASAVLALLDGLILHAGLDPQAFKWENVSGAVDSMLGNLSLNRAL